MNRKYLSGLAALFASAIGMQSGSHAADNPCATSPDSRFADEQSGASITYKSSNVTLTVHRGKGGTPLTIGFNALDKAVPLNCVDPAGCVLTSTSLIKSAFNSFVCTYLDGKSMRPPSLNISTDPGSTLQSARVTTGAHSVVTEIKALNNDTLGPWEINYALYDN
jgi:hypothetical protein